MAAISTGFRIWRPPTSIERDVGFVYKHHELNFQSLYFAPKKSFYLFNARMGAVVILVYEGSGKVWPQARGYDRSTYNLGYRIGRCSDGLARISCDCSM